MSKLDQLMTKLDEITQKIESLEQAQKDDEAAIETIKQTIVMREDRIEDAKQMQSVLQLSIEAIKESQVSHDDEMRLMVTQEEQLKEHKKDFLMRLRDKEEPITSDDIEQLAKFDGIFFDEASD